MEDIWVLNGILKGVNIRISNEFRGDFIGGLFLDRGMVVGLREFFVMKIK